MSSIEFTIVPPPTALAEDVECFRTALHANSKELAVRVCPNGHPGIAFLSRSGEPAVHDITTRSGRIAHVPVLFLYGQITELSVMRFKAPLDTPYTTIQVVLKPYALRTLFGLDASTLTNSSVGAAGFDAEALRLQLLAAANDHERIGLLERFLIAKRKQASGRDAVIEASINLISQSIDSVTVEWLLGRVGLSERQFERRFMQMVGVTPQLYIRVRRVNEAMRLMDTGRFERLADVAHALNYHDQSHFIRDIRTFSGTTPRSISQKVNEFHRDRVGSSYLYA